MKKIFSFILFLGLIQTVAFNKTHFEFKLNENYDNTCGSSACTCDIAYTITNNTGGDWNGRFVGLGAPFNCNEILTVPTGSSTTFNATIDANEPGSNAIRYFVTPSTGNPNFNDPNLSIDFSSACELNFGINNQGNARIVPVNGTCGGGATCDFTFLTDGCHVCFTALSDVPGILHSWDFDGDNIYDISTSEITVCTTYDAPGGSFSVNHLYNGLVCNQTVTVTCDNPCDRDYQFVRTCGYPAGLLCPETASSPTACEVECCDDENPGQIDHLMITNNTPNPFGACDRSFACDEDVFWYNAQDVLIYGNSFSVNYPYNGEYAAYAVIIRNTEEGQCIDTVFVDIECPESCELLPPANLGCQIAGNQTQLAWDPVPNSVAYILNFFDGTGACNCTTPFPGLEEQTTTSTHFVLDNEMAGECFSWQVQAQCADGSLSDPAQACYSPQHFCEQLEGFGDSPNKGSTIFFNPKIFPNPANSHFTLELNAPEALTLSLAIYNIDGVLVRAYGEETIKSGKFKKPIDDLTLDHGLYYILFKTNFGNFHQKLTVVK